MTEVNERSVRLLREMMRIRLYEECIATHVETGEIRTPCHLYIGQEAIAAGVCATLDKGDYVFSMYRGHGHYLARGGDGKAFLAEVFCRETGCCRGRGGSMHLVAPELGLMGNTAIVGGHISLAAGGALTCKLAGKNRVSVAFFGDAVAEEGVFSEVVNFAALHRLPLVLVCENNLYAAHMHIRDRQVTDRVSCRVDPLMPVALVDGNDAEAVYVAATAAISAARDGGGPQFIECRTYRWRGHVGPKDDIDRHIRSSEELAAWMTRCPIRRVEQALIASGEWTEERTKDMRREIQAEVNESLAFAKSSPYPAASSLLDGVYAVTSEGN